MMDFGSALDVGRDRRWRYGTPGYLAPEMLSNQEIAPSADVYAFGALVYELITGLSPLQEVQSALSQEGESDWYQMATSVTINLDEIERERNEWRATLDSVRRQMLCIKSSAALSSHSTPTALIDLVRSSLAFDPLRRPSAQQIRQVVERLVPGADRRNPTSVFISHSHEDKRRFVVQFAKSLKKRGINVWLDEWSLRVGESFWDRISTALEQADFIIVVLSQYSITSQGVSEELRMAQLLNLGSTPKILPIRIDPIEFKSIPLVLRSRQILDFVGWSDSKVYTGHVTKLIADIAALQTQRGTK